MNIASIGFKINSAPTKTIVDQLAQEIFGSEDEDRNGGPKGERFPSH